MAMANVICCHCLTYILDVKCSHYWLELFHYHFSVRSVPLLDLNS
uniref:Uncharacterized protein n=1 Tax=Anguilla anguilla TaxID=7936 RepID=A0A0E9WJZ6_ANGAN